MSDDAGNAPVPYMERTRLYYRALGYESDYVWAKFEDVPFAQLAKPLSQMNVALVTTAGPPDLSNRDARGRKRVWSGDPLAPPDKWDTDVAWDRESTHLDDRETFLPIDATRKALAKGVIGGLARRFHGAPTDYSHRKTLEEDAPEILRRLREDGADAALIIAL
jgi:hypothetical protein